MNERATRPSVKILITGFEPFGGARINPSHELLKLLHGVYPTLLLPNNIRRAPGILMKTVARLRPDAVLHLGESREARSIFVERGAVNRLETTNELGVDIPDKSGNSAHNEPIVKGAPPFLRSTMPVERIVEAIRACRIPAHLRDHGGTHVSNEVFYLLLHSRKVRRVGYIHIPPVQVLKGGHGMALSRLLMAVGAAIEVLEGKSPPVSSRLGYRPLRLAI